MNRRNAVTAFLILSGSVNFACGQGLGPSGEDVVDVVCAGCHAKGAQGAPRIGDRAAWAKRAKQGIDSLTQHALDGVREMPAHGGDSTLSDLMIRRAVVYMVNKSGGNWIEPFVDPKLARERSGEQVVQMQCAACHEKGFGGAPQIGDRAAWTQRLRLGIDPLVRSANRARAGMPQRSGMFPCGGLASVSDEEIRGAIIYMASSARTRPADPVRKAPCVDCQREGLGRTGAN
jgi:cytochrome c5